MKINQLSTLPQLPLVLLLLFLFVMPTLVDAAKEYEMDFSIQEINEEIYHTMNKLNNLKARREDFIKNGFDINILHDNKLKNRYNQSIEDTDLYKYIHKEDPHYSWKNTGVTIKGTSLFCKHNCSFTGYLLNLTSQGWLTKKETSCSVWTHQLVVIVPDTLNEANETTAFLYVTGGDNNDVSPPSSDSDDVALPGTVAVATGTIGAVLFQVPNQPCTFADDPVHEERSEDSFCAYTWAHYMNTHPKSVEYVSLLPMVKSVVKAMDTITAFRNGKVKQFVVAGASKRGWTTWLTAPVDKRVVAIAPIVMDLLDFEAGLLHMFRSYGGWTFAFEPYWKQNITQSIIDNPIGLAALGKVLDPLNYKENLKVPKLVIDATGDEFFMPDDDWFWWKEMSDGSVGEIYRLMCDNAEHSFSTGVYELVTGLVPFYHSILLGSQRPKFDWKLNHIDGTIDLVTETTPLRVVLRQATTSDNVRRDFRLIKGDTKTDPCKFIPVKVFGEACLNPVLWCGSTISPSIEVVQNGDIKMNSYKASVPIPPDGKWRAFLLELYFPTGASDENDGKNAFIVSGNQELTQTFKFTTQVQIVPYSFPFKNCSTAKECKGHLV